MKKILASLLLAITAGGAHAAMCNGPSESVVAPIVKMNINNFLPVTLAGASMEVGGNSRNCPMVTRQSICTCPGRLFGTPTPGPVLTFHMPQYVAEVTGNAGCSPLLGGQQILGNSYRKLNTGDENQSRGIGMTRQVHWLEYPVFSILEMMKDTICFQTSSSIDVAYMTEIDPLWNNDLWGAIFTPESVLFTTMPVIAACSVDAVSTTFTRCNVDPLLWCSGGNHIYPFTSYQDSSDDQVVGNVKALNRFMHRHARVGALWRTVGPDAVCNPQISPIMVPSQYRLDLIWPFGTTSGKPIALGTNAMVWGSPANMFLNEHSLFLIWNAQQCCMNI